MEIMYDKAQDRNVHTHLCDGLEQYDCRFSFVPACIIYSRMLRGTDRALRLIEAGLPALDIIWFQLKAVPAGFPSW